ncbi:MAG: hypothetical protein R3C25_10480 [Hyphomonadaceae bacterium]
MSKPRAELIDPRDAGVRRIELKKPVFDAGAVERAENALHEMSSEMALWLDADVARLQAARVDADLQRWSSASVEALYAVAHDLKGLGGTCGSPIATQLAASLCRLIETEAGQALACSDPSLAQAHVDALRAVVRNGVRTTDHPVGSALLQALETRVAALGVAPH